MPRQKIRGSVYVLPSVTGHNSLVMVGLWCLRRNYRRFKYGEKYIEGCVEHYMHSLSSSIQKCALVAS